MQTVDLRRFPISPGHRTLDIGCGEGRHAIAVWRAGGGVSVGLDRNHADLHAAAQRAEATGRLLEDAPRGRLLWLRGDAGRLPFANGSFDRVICSEVLEHLPDYHSALREIRRVLKADGLFCASVPRWWPEWLCWRLSRQYSLEPGGHVRIFRSGQLRRAVEACGFRRYHRHWSHALHTPFWWLKCLLWEQRETHWLVRAYHRLLVWDMLRRRPWTRWPERWLNPLLGKSVVMYFHGATRP